MPSVNGGPSVTQNPNYQSNMSSPGVVNPAAGPVVLTSAQVADGATGGAGITDYQKNNNSLIALTGLLIRGGVCCGGDSLMAFGDVAGALTQTASGVLAATGGKTSQSVIAWTDAYLGGNHLTLVTNRGVGSTTIDVNSNSLIGTTTPQLTNLFPDRAEILWLHSGTNHLNPTIDSAAPTAAQIIQKMRRVVGVAAARKSFVIVEGIYPIGLGSAVNHYLRRNDIPTINAGFQAICANFRNVMYLDPSPLSIDGGATGDPQYYLASDLLHLNTRGASLLGASYAQQIKGRLRLLPSYRLTKTVLMPEMAGTSGGKTPNSGVINGTMPGNMRMIIGSGTTAGYPIINLTTANNRLTASIDNSGGLVTAVTTIDLNSRTAYLGTFANTDIMIATGTIGITNPIGLRKHDFIMTQNSEGVGTLAAISAMAKSNQVVINSNVPVFPNSSYGPITLSTQPFTINDTLASINVGYSIELAAGGSVTIDIGDLTLDAVTPF